MTSTETKTETITVGDINLSLNPGFLGKEEMEEMLKEITIMYELCSQIYDSRNLSSANLVFEHEEIVDALKDTMGANHIKRLSEGSCTPEVGAIYLNLASNCERVGDHLKTL